MILASRGGWNSTSTEFPVIGGSIRNKGACTSPLFVFALLIPLFPSRINLVPSLLTILISASGRVPKKVSGRWGHRPLGVGDGGFVTGKSIRLTVVPRRWPFHCARKQQKDTQDKDHDDHASASRAETHSL